LGKIRYYIEEGSRRFLHSMSSEGREISRLSRFPRYLGTTTKILGFELSLLDAPSFIGQYNSIIKQQIYRFNCDHEDPFIIDCGANIGISLIYFCRLYPKSNIIAFEADKKVFSFLSKNMKNSPYSNQVVLVNKAVWKEEGIISFNPDGADGGQITDENEPVKYDLEKLESCRLYSYLDRPVDFLKIDIEGAEKEVIVDCADRLCNVKQIFVEYHSAPGKEQDLDTILRILRTNGFRYFIQQATIDNQMPFVEIKELFGYDNLLNIYAIR